MAEKVTSATWFKNAAKSLGYGVGQHLKKTAMPYTMEMIETNDDLIKSAIDKIRSKSVTNHKKDLKDFLGKKANELANTVGEIKSNAISDLKTGKFINKERNAGSGFGDDLDFGGDFSFDDADFSFGDDFDNGPDVNVNNIAVSTNIDRNNPMVKAVQTQSELQVEIANANAERDVSLANAQMMHSTKLTESIHAALGVVNQNLGLLINFNNNTMAGYIGSSLEYYKTATQHMENLTTELKKVSSYYEKLNMNTSARDVKRHDSMSIFSGAEGGLNITEYGKLIKKNMDNYIDSSPILSSLKLAKTMNDTMGGTKITSPLEFIPMAIAKAIIPGSVTALLQGFDKTFKTFVPALLSKLFDDGDDMFGDGTVGGYIKNSLSSIFGVDKSAKFKVDTSNYEKGAIPFDGVTRKSIVEVIPTYLRKILSAITGNDEMIYNFKTGKFNSRKTIVKEDRDQRRRLVNSEYTASGRFKNAANAVTSNKAEQERLQNVVDSFFMNLTERKKMFNPEKDSDLDDIMKNASASEKRFIKALIKSLSKGERMELSGYNHLSARQKMSNYITDIEGSDDLAKLTLHNNSDGDGFSVGRGGMYGVDKYGKRAIDYIRDIKNILLDGINVRIVPRQSNSQRRRGRESRTSRSTADGGVVSSEDGPSYSSKSDDELLAIISSVDSKYSYGDDTEKRKRELPKVLQNLRNKLFGEDETSQNFIQRVFSKAYDKVAEGTTNFFDKVNNGLYNLVFGVKTDGEEKGSILDKITGGMKKFYADIKEKLFGKDGFFTAIKNSDFMKNLKEKGKKLADYLFGTREGDDGPRSGGLFSDIANEVRGIGNKLKLYVTGIIKDKDGNVIERNKNSVFDEFKDIFKGFKDSIKEWFSSKTKGGEDKKDGIWDQVKDAIGSGVTNFSNMFFGVSKDKDGKFNSKLNTDEIMDSIKKRAPKSLAGGIFGGAAGILAGAGGFGVLGSLFLGPMSGAVIGIATGFLSQSDKFKDWLFGAEVDGERTGGFISKSTQNFFKEHKGALLGGAAFGGLKGLLGFGFLPSFIMGGPITGALTGLATSLVFKSGVFQDFLFGKEGKEGIVGKISNKFNEKFNKDVLKEKFGTLAVGGLGGAALGGALSSFGLLGAIGFGPLTGAIAGIGAGLIATSDKWKTRLFGTFDENGDQKEFGLFGKLGLSMETNIIQPLKVKIMDWRFKFENWFESEVALPFAGALEPFKEEFKRFGKKISNFFVGIGEKLGIPDMIDGVKTSVTSFVKWMGDKFKTVTDKAITGIGKIAATIASAPGKFLNSIAEKFLIPKHMKQGLSHIRGVIINNIKETITSSEFYKEIYQPMKIIIGHGVDFVVERFKKGISGIFGFAKNVILGTFKGAGKLIAAPFKDIAVMFKGIGQFRNYLRNKSMENADQNKLSGILAGNRSVGRSVLDLASTFMPFSGVHNAAKWSDEGAGYNEARVAALNARKAEYQKNKEDRAKLQEQLNEITASSKDILNNKDLSDKEKKERLAENKKKMNELIDSSPIGKSSGFKKIVDKANKKDEQKLAKDKEKSLNKKYGKTYKGLSALEKDRFKIQNETLDETKETNNWLKRILNFFVSGGKSESSNRTNNAPTVKSATISKNTGGTAESELTGKTNEQTGPTPVTGSHSDGSTDVIFDENGNKISDGKIGNTAAEQILEDKAEDSAKQRKGFLWKIVNGIEGMKKTAEEHKDLFDGIFGKKGLITMGIIALLPWLMKFFQDPGKFLSGLFSGAGNFLSEILGLKDDDGDRTDATGDVQKNSDAIAAVTRGAGYATSKGLQFGDNVYQAGKKMYQGVKKFGKGVSTTIGNVREYATVRKALKGADDSAINIYNKALSESGEKGYKYLSGEVIEKASKEYAQEVSQKAYKEVLGKSGEKAAKKAAKNAYKEATNITAKEALEKVTKKATTSGADDLAKASKAGNSAIFSKFRELISTAATKLKGFLTDKFPKLSKHMDDIISPIIKNSAKLTDNVLTRFIGNISKLFTRLGITATGVGVAIDVAFAVGGGISGATKASAANLFQVPQDTVDGTMRTISSAFKALVNLSWFFIIDLADDIIEAVTGISILNKTAVLLYKFFKQNDTEAIEKFTLAQDTFKTNFGDYTLAQQLMIDNVQKDENGNILYLDESGNLTTENTGNVAYKDTSKVTESQASYNDRVNKSGVSKFFGKMGQGISTGWKSIFGSKGNEEEYNKSINQKKILEEAYANGQISEESYKLSMESLDKSLAKNKKHTSVFVKAGKGIAKGATAAWDWTKTKANGAADWLSNKANKAVDTFKWLTTKKTTTAYLNTSDGSYYTPDGKHYSIEDVEMDTISLEELSTMIMSGQLVETEIVTKKAGYQQIIDEVREKATAVFNNFTTGAKSLWNKTVKKVSDTWTKLGEIDEKVETSVRNFFVKHTENRWFSVNGGYYQSNGSTFDYYNATGDLISSGISQDEFDKLATSGTIILANKETVTIDSGIKTKLTEIGSNIAKTWSKFTSKASEFIGKAKDKAEDVIIKAIELDNKVRTGIKNFFVKHTEKRWYSIDGGYYQSNGSTFDYYNAAGDKINSGISQDEFDSLCKSGVITSTDGETVTVDSGIKTILSSFSTSIKEAFTKLTGAASNLYKSVKENAGKLFTAIKDSGGIKGFLGGLFKNQTTKVWYDTDGNYYKLESSGKYSKYNINGDVITDNIPASKVQELATSGLLTLGDRQVDTDAQKAIKEIQSAVKDGWNKAKSTVTSGWKKFTSWLSGTGGVDEAISSSSGPTYPIVSNSYGSRSFGGPNTGGVPMDILNKYNMPSSGGTYGKVRSTGKVHKGVDLTLPVNSPIYSFTDGEVIAIDKSHRPNSGRYPNGKGYGNYVKVKDDKGYIHIYAHLNKVNATKGQKVGIGSQLGLEGHTGNSTGPHLHYEVRRTNDASTHIDPLAYIASYDDDYVNNKKIDSTSSGGTTTTEKTVAGTGLVGAIELLTNTQSDMFKPFSEAASMLGERTANLYGTTSSTTTETVNNGSSSSSYSSSASGSNGKRIWEYLTKKMGLSKKAAAGVMGNLDKESGLNPNNLENKYNKSLGYTDDAYTSAVDSGKYKNFIKDKAGYGLAQWTYHTRKKAMYDYLKSRNLSIADLEGQLGYLEQELAKSYPTVLNKLRSAGSVRAASDVFLKEFEKPANQGLSVQQARAAAGQKYLDEFGGVDLPISINSAMANRFNNISTLHRMNRYNNIGGSDSNISIPDKLYEVLDKVVTALREIAGNTKSTSEGIKTIKTQSSNKAVVVDNSSKTTNNPMYEAASNSRSNESSKNYNVAKSIAMGIQ